MRLSRALELANEALEEQRERCSGEERVAELTDAYDTIRGYIPSVEEDEADYAKNFEDDLEDEELFTVDEEGELEAKPPHEVWLDQYNKLPPKQRQEVRRKLKELGFPVDE